MNKLTFYNTNYKTTQDINIVIYKSVIDSSLERTGDPQNTDSHTR